MSLAQAHEITTAQAEVPGTEAELLALAKQSGLTAVRDELIPLSTEHGVRLELANAPADTHSVASVRAFARPSRGTDS